MTREILFRGKRIEPIGAVIYLECFAASMSIKNGISRI